MQPGRVLERGQRAHLAAGLPEVVQHAGVA
jgi:hypothetical protein